MLIRERSCTFRYRVVQLLGTSEVAGVLTGFGGAGTTKEFKTLRAARRYQKSLSEGQRWPVLLQVGCVQWLSEDEASEWAQQHRGDPWE